jgi:type I restriction enzyme M protein
MNNMFDMIPAVDAAKDDYILTPGRYVGIADVEDYGEPFGEKTERQTVEFSGLFAKSSEAEKEICRQLSCLKNSS